MLCTANGRTKKVSDPTLNGLCSLAQFSMGRNHIFIHCHECRNHGRCRKERTFSGTCYVPGCIIEDTRDANAVHEIKKIIAPKQEITMHIIGFSHHYTKIHMQTHGILLSSRVISEEEFKRLREDRCTIYYDSVFSENDKEYVRGIGADERLQLVFIGDRQIPFTTYRKIPESHIIRANGRILTPEYPYIDLIGTRFAFKFKGEALPREFASRITADSVRIFD